MCDICDGMSPQQVLAKSRRLVEENGFTMVGVEAPTPWTYTIGLLATCDHPELVLTGLDPGPASGILGLVARRACGGERFDPGTDLAVVDDFPIRFGEVHPAQWRHGRFDSWLEFYRWSRSRPPSPKALQVLWPNDDNVFPPDPDFCPEHDGRCQPLLSAPPTRNVNKPNRTQRRRKRQR